MLDTKTMVLFCFYFYVTSMGAVRFLYHQSAGLFWQWRYWTIAEAAVNVLGNYILVQAWGLFGVVAATVISLLTIDFGFSTFIVYKFYFKNGKTWMYFRDHMLYLFVTALVTAITYFVCSFGPSAGISALALRLVICIILPNAMFVGIYYRLPVFKEAMGIANRVLKYITKRSQ